jgi:hypothetical protein
MSERRNPLDDDIHADAAATPDEQFLVVRTSHDAIVYHTGDVLTLPQSAS